jgi:formamidase
MALHDIRLDLSVPWAAQTLWHKTQANIPGPVLRVEAGDEIVVDTLDRADTQITPESVSGDLNRLDPDRCPPVIGPIAVAGAAPGDVLVLEVLACEPAPFGYTAQRPGIGPLGADPEFAEPFLVLWRLADGYANSADLPGVKIAPRPFLGAATLAPTPPHGCSDAHAQRFPHTPNPRSGTDQPQTPPTNRATAPLAYADVGTRLLLPVWVPEALLSIGDSYYTCGEGHLSPGIAMGATWRLRLNLRKGQAITRGQRWPHFERGPRPITPHHHSPVHIARGGSAGSGRIYATTGVRVVANGPEPDNDIGSAAREALREMIEYLRDEHRYSAHQAYALCAAAVDLRVTAAPRTATHTAITVTALLPLDIFDD